MAFMIPCPHCGPREVGEFKFGGEVKAPPGPEADLEAWRRYNYHPGNRAGLQEEWWFHAWGCQTWFKIRRDTSTNRIMTD